MLRACVLWSVLLAAWVSVSVVRSDEDLVIDTTQGPVRGHFNQDGYYQFFGIPYATAPTGEHKFKAPLPPPKWTDIFDATENTTLCHQPHISLLLLSLPGFPTEDCLILNVFVPKTDKKNIPVIVYIHGGAFVQGVGNMVTHDALLKHEVIVVNFNYRLGVYGFLCLGTKDIPGNAGMKDQVAALRWVQRNIANFGGNPDDVTIAGFSAGSAAVEHLMLSPMAKGLFKKVIGESGSALSAWAITPDPIEMAKRYIQDTTGAVADDLKDIEDYYKSLSSLELTEKHYMTEPDTSIGFGPCVEREIEGEESFYTESPLDIMKKTDYAKLPLLTGFAREEGIFRIDLFKKWSEKMEHTFSDFLPQDLKFISQDEKNATADKVKKFYFENDFVDDSKLKEYVDYFTDVMFAYSIAKSARIHAQNSVPVYLYNFAYVMSSPHSHHSKIKGATHCAQTATLNTLSFMPSTNYTEEDKLIKNRLAEMWTNFAKYGKPVPETSDLVPVNWNRLDPDRMNYLLIDLDLEEREDLLVRSRELWDEIYDQHYRRPVPPVLPLRVHQEL